MDKHTRMCSVEGCARRLSARGYCATHYRHWYRTGEPGPASITSANVRQCAVYKCERPHYGKGYCQAHHQRKYKTGDVGDANIRSDFARGSNEDRLRHYGWTEVVRVPHLGECWEWGGHIMRQGYGLIPAVDRTRRVHRVAFEVWNGPIPPGLIIRHKCDNPPCINPKHLECGTTADNAADRVSRGRTLRGEDNLSAKLNEAKVREIRAGRPAGVAACRELARKYGVSESAIWRVLNRTTWRHVA